MPEHQPQPRSLPRILVVDDERFNRNVLTDLLKPDYSVVLAKSGEQALSKAGSSNPPDLILLDIMMPEMDGYEVCRRLKADPATRDIPVIFVTAMQEAEDEMKGLATGAIDYIAKPFSPAIVQARVQNHIALKLAQSRIEEAHAKVALLLHNSGQGFLSFGRDLLVDSELSQECAKIFLPVLGGQSPAGRPLDTLLYPDDQKARALFADNISRVFRESDDYIQTLYLSLLEREFSFGERFYEAEFKRVADTRIMCILTDVTQERQLEHAVNLERVRLSFIVSAVKDTEELFEVLDEFDTFLNELPEIAATISDTQLLVADMHRRIHTFKGLFAQLEFIHTPTCLHELESALAALGEAPGTSTQRLLQAVAESGCREALEADQAILREVLGPSFFKNRDTMAISKRQASLLERIATRLLDNPEPRLDDELKHVLEDFKRIRHVSVASLLESYPKMASKLAERLGKKVEPVRVTGEDIRVHPDHYGAFFRSLVHVFRNTLDHGVETPDERVGLGKEEAGVIGCRVVRDNRAMILTISDDGAGLDVARLREKAVERQVLGQDEAAALPDQEVMELIFLDAMTTTNGISDISGRGVGLSSVKAELDRLGGEVAVSSTPGGGTTMRFTLPLAVSG